METFTQTNTHSEQWERHAVKCSTRLHVFVLYSLFFALHCNSNKWHEQIQWIKEQLQLNWKISPLNPNNIKYNKIITYKLISDKFRADKCLNLKLTRFINDIYFIIIQMRIEVSAKVHTAHIHQRQRAHTRIPQRECSIFCAIKFKMCTHCLVLLCQAKPSQAMPCHTKPSCELIEEQNNFL